MAELKPDNWIYKTWLVGNQPFEELEGVKFYRSFNSFFSDELSEAEMEALRAYPEIELILMSNAGMLGEGSPSNLDF